MYIHHSFFLNKSAKCLLKYGLCSVFFFTSFPNAAEMAYIIYKNEKKKSVTQVQVGEHQWRGYLSEFLKSIKLDFLKTSKQQNL